MQLEGSCHCGAVTFRLNSKHPYPFNYCYCSICCKTTGGGGFAINLSGDFESLQVEGEEHISVYQAKLRDDDGEEHESPAQRSFCAQCGSHLWLWDPRWPELLHPLAAVIDSELPQAPERTHSLLGSKAAWVAPDVASNDKTFEHYSDESIAQWHQRLGLER